MAGKRTVVKKGDSQRRRVRMLDGKEVKPVLYNGRGIGHGKYFAASIDGQLLCDKDGKPFLFREVGKLQDV